MLGDTELNASYNIPVSNNTIILPEETGVEIGENLLLVKWVDDSYRIVNSRVYEGIIYDFLKTKGFKPGRIIQSSEVRALMRAFFGRMVKSDIKVGNGYRISLGREYKGAKRVVLSPKTKSLEIIKQEVY